MFDETGGSQEANLVMIPLTGPICEPKVSGILWELQTPEPREPTGGFHIPDISLHVMDSVPALCGQKC
jgi:hypothetical protein